MDAIRLLASLGALFGVGLACAGPVVAQEPFYKGKTVRIVISVGVAGGFGEYARTLAEHLTRHIPGQPGVIVQSMPGAGGLVATNHLYNQAAQDGTTIAIINATLPLTPLMGNKNARYDALKFHWLGAMDHADGACTFWRGSGMDTLADLRTKQPTVGSIGAGSPMEVYALLLNKLLGTQIRVVGGYKAGSDIDLAMQRGEVDGRCGTHLNTIKAMHPDWLVGPKFTVPVLVADARRPDWPDTPSIMELVKDEADRQTIRLFMVPQVLNRPVLAPPNVPAERVAELRKALMATMEDKVFLADIARRNLQVNPTSGERVAQMLAEAYAMPPKVVAAVRDIVGQK